MKALRTIHLALGCLFTPMLIVFTVSGIWQSVPSSFTQSLPSWLVNPMALLGTLHTGRALKLGQTLSSGVMTILVIAMAMSFLLTIILGVVMAFRFGRPKVALGCLLLGVIVPASVCLMAYRKQTELRTNASDELRK